MFIMSQKIYCLQKIKYLKYKQIKSYKSVIDPNEFAKIVDLNNRLWESIYKNVINSIKK